MDVLHQQLRIAMLSHFERARSFLGREVSAEGLAVFRIAFGLLMAIDTVNERGFGVVDKRWGNLEPVATL